MRNRLSLKSAQGQAVVEYILMLAVALTVVGLVGAGFLRIRNYLLQQITCEVAAACPDCPAQDAIRNKLVKKNVCK